jgi:hypothetical protein
LISYAATGRVLVKNYVRGRCEDRVMLSGNKAVVFAD